MFVCFEDCGNPPAVTFASAVYFSTVEGSSVTYTCPTGYVTQGLSQAVCTSSGNWTSTPVCAAGKGHLSSIYTGWLNDYSRNFLF